LHSNRAAPPDDVRRVGEYLEGKCEQVEGFPCRILAKHLEAGDLGPFDAGRIRELLRRACDGGDPDACGAPATVAGTFE
jgi:hypothetical protein